MAEHASHADRSRFCGSDYGPERAWRGNGSHPAPAPAPARPAGAPRAGGLPEAVALPGPAAGGCTLRAAKSGVGVTLEIAPGVPYARVAPVGSMEVTLPIGRDAPAAAVSVAAGNVKLKGLATPSGLALYAARPFVVGEVLVPGPHSRLRWGEVAADRVGVEVELAKDSRTEFRDVKGPLRASRPCGDLRLTSLANFDSYDALGGRGNDQAAGLRSSAPGADRGAAERPRAGEAGRQPEGRLQRGDGHRRGRRRDGRGSRGPRPAICSWSAG